MAPFFMLDDFLMYLRSEKRYSEHTCVAYKKDLEQFVEFVGIQEEVEVKEVQLNIIRSWMVDLIEKGYTTKSVHRKIATVRSFYKWLQRKGEVETNPAQLIQLPKLAKKPPSFAHVEDVKNEKIQELFDDSFNGVRDYLMFELLYQTGIRSSELISLKESDVTKDRIKVLGKRNKERFIPISKSLKTQIDHYRELKRTHQLKNDFLIVLNNGKKIYPKFVYRKINDYLSKATELSVKSPHVLRHTFATHMLNSGAGLEVLKELLGHSNLSATQVYTHNSFAQLTNIYSQSHPRGIKN